MKLSWLLVLLLTTLPAFALDRHQILQMDKDYNYTCNHCWKELAQNDSNWYSIYRITKESCSSYAMALKDAAKALGKEKNMKVESCIQFYANSGDEKPINLEALTFCKKQLGSKMSADANTCMVTKWSTQQSNKSAPKKTISSTQAEDTNGADTTNTN